MTQGPFGLFFLLTVPALVRCRLDANGYGASPDVLAELEDYFNDGLWPLPPIPRSDEQQLLFPTLTEEQQKFAVNPSYPAFKAPVFGDPNAPQEEPDREWAGDDETVEGDPYFSTDSYVPPKKASLKALLGQDPRVLATAIEDERINDIYFTTIVGVSSGLTVFVIVGMGFLFHRARKNAKAAEDVEYPAYGVTGPGKDISPSSGDRKLAQNAQLYHYQHQKQQMMAFDNSAGGGGAGGSNGDSQRRSMSDNESEDGEEGDYTVYECPGLAPTGEMEVRNPMFEDEVTPRASK